MNTVHAIRDPDKLFEIQDSLQHETSAHGRRIFLLFEMGIHTGLRISDLIRLRVKNVSGMDIFTIEKKTGKQSILPLDAQIRAIIQDRTRDLSPDDYIFPSRNAAPDGTRKHITTRTAYDDMQIIARRFNLDGCIGCHTLRKTFGYWHHKQNNNLELLRQWFNHSTVDVTRRYIGVDLDERRKSVIGFNPGGLKYIPSGPVNKGKTRTPSDPLEISNLDRTKQGAHRAEAMRQSAEKQNAKKKK